MPAFDYRRRMGPAPSGASDPIGDALRADVVAYYTLGSTADSGPNGYTLTNNNATAFGAGKVGNCATFNDAGNTSLSRAGADLDITTTDFAFSFWIKTTADDDWIFTKGVNAASRGYWCYTGANLTFTLLSAGASFSFTTAGATLNDDAWHHVVVNADRDALIDIYVDGVNRKSASVAVASGNLTTATDFYLAQLHGDTTAILDGSLDEFGFWRRLLTADEIAHLYAAGAGVSLYP